MRPETGLANDAWEALLSAHAVVMKELAAEDIWGDVSMREYDVLYTLSKCLAPMRLGDLNRHVLLSQPALSRMVDRMVSRGLVRRSPDQSDARGILLALTDDGRARQRDIGRAHARHVAHAVTSRLTPDEVRTLAVIGRKLSTDKDDS